MEVRIEQLTDLSKIPSMYLLMTQSHHKAGILSRITENDFTSILLNGITLLACNNGQIIGYVNFEVLSDVNQKYSIHNFLIVDKKYSYEEISRLLYQAEFVYVKEEGDVDCILAKVVKDDYQTSKSLKKNGFQLDNIGNYNYKDFVYFGSTYCRPVRTESFDFKSVLKRKIKLLGKKHFMYAASGDWGFLYKQFLNLKSRYVDHETVKAQQKLIREIKKRQKAKVLFIASSLSMWKYQYLYELLIKDARFDVNILTFPFDNWTLEHRTKEIQNIREFFNANHIEFIDNESLTYDIRKNINPDIIFFPQPYPLTSDDFRDKLLSYYPYGYYIEDEECYYNNPFQEIAWKLFYSNELQREHAEKYARNKGRNVAIVGYPLADRFSQKASTNPWKPQHTLKKKIIWAPHFSINSNTSFTNHSNFLFMADLMLELAETYKDDIQIAFKPHPRLKTELYNNHNWGNERTDAYYAKWESLENGQLELGDFVDLFITSDAMIHDSASFCVDYLYTNNPVMYISSDIEKYKQGLDSMGKQVMDMHYIGDSKEDIEHFIKNVVLLKQDSKLEERTRFREEYLLPPNGKTTAQNTLDEMVKSLFV